MCSHFLLYSFVNFPQGTCTAFTKGRYSLEKDASNCITKPHRHLSNEDFQKTQITELWFQSINASPLTEKMFLFLKIWIIKDLTHQTKPSAYVHLLCQLRRVLPPGSWSSTTLLLSAHFKRTHRIEQGNGNSLFSSYVCALRERHRSYAYRRLYA